jgi:hypothetical protein
LEGSLETHSIKDVGAIVDAYEGVLVTESLEGPLYLLVGEERWSLELNDPTRHRPIRTEMSGTPGDLLAEPDLSARDATDSALVGCRHRGPVEIDAQSEIEDPFDRRRDS